MKNKLLIIALCLISGSVFSQNRMYNLTVQFDSVKVRKLIMTSIATGGATDSVLVKKPNGGMFKVARSGFGTGSGTVTSFGKTDNYGITSSVANPTTTPVLTIGVDTTSGTGLVSKSRLTAYAYSKAQTDALIAIVSSGTYTPTITNGTNVSASTARLCHWIRVGNEVTVRGQVNVTCSGTNSSDLQISLPVGHTSNFATVYDASGNGSIFMGSERFVSINADITTDLPQLLWSGTASTSEVWFSFTYTVIP